MEELLLLRVGARDFLRGRRSGRSRRGGEVIVVDLLDLEAVFRSSALQEARDLFLRDRSQQRLVLLQLRKGVLNAVIGVFLGSLGTLVAAAAWQRPWRRLQP